MTLAEARKRYQKAAADYVAGKATFDQGKAAYRRVIRIREAAIRKANAKIMEANAKLFPLNALRRLYHNRNKPKEPTDGKDARGVDRESTTRTE
jgi:hypothetical protein